MRVLIDLIPLISARLNWSRTEVESLHLRRLFMLMKEKPDTHD